MGPSLKLAVMVVSANRHCPALGLLQTQGFIFCLAGLRKADLHGVGQTNIRSLASRSPVGNKVLCQERMAGIIEKE
jgi:hypothetical protein